MPYFYLFGWNFATLCLDRKAQKKFLSVGKMFPLYSILLHKFSKLKIKKKEERKKRGRKDGGEVTKVTFSEESDSVATFFFLKWQKVTK